MRAVAQTPSLTLGAPRLEGQVTRAGGVLIEGTAPGAALGDLYRIVRPGRSDLAEVVAIHGRDAVLMPFDRLTGLTSGARLSKVDIGSDVLVGDPLCGRVVDAFGQPMDGKPSPSGLTAQPLWRNPPSFGERAGGVTAFELGVRALDGLVPCAQGQRFGIFSGPGVGKTHLLGMLARHTRADRIVVGLVGERGQEAKRFVHDVLDEESRRRALVVVATSDRAAPERVRAPTYCMAAAEYWRDQGANVLLLVDSMTRVCMAQREIGLATDEPPTSRGYPPSVFALMPQLFERAGAIEPAGSITAYFSVLVESDDLSDPIAQAVQGLLDGHIFLSRAYAETDVYPAVDPVRSLSRLEGEILPESTLHATRQVRHWCSKLDESRELMAMGAYQEGADPHLDRAVLAQEKIRAFLRQGTRERVPRSEGLDSLHALAGIA